MRPSLPQPSIDGGRVRGCERPAHLAQEYGDPMGQLIGMKVGRSLETGRYQWAPHCIPVLEATILLLCALNVTPSVVKISLPGWGQCQHLGNQDRLPHGSAPSPLKMEVKVGAGSKGPVSSSDRDFPSHSLPPLLRTPFTPMPCHLRPL